MRKDEIMITAIGSTGLRPALDALRSGFARGAQAAGTAAAKAQADGVSSPVAALVAEGAPVDMDKVAAIKAGLANGTYKIDPQAIAAKMIADDLPRA